VHCCPTMPAPRAYTILSLYTYVYIYVGILLLLFSRPSLSVPRLTPSMSLLVASCMLSHHPTHASALKTHKLLITIQKEASRAPKADTTHPKTSEILPNQIYRHPKQIIPPTPQPLAQSQNLPYRKETKAPQRRTSMLPKQQEASLFHPAYPILILAGQPIFMPSPLQAQNPRNPGTETIHAALAPTHPLNAAQNPQKQR
jgi:hypothetical protein